jgi:4-hydroxy-tetrahydrodipicolinate reductase
MKVALFGASGRMGQSITQSAPAKDTIIVYDPAACDVLIDFSHPDVLKHHLDTALTHHKPLVLGTTGLTPQQLDQVKEAAASIPILYASNMSLGACALGHLVTQAASFLGEPFDIEIIETHHKKKVDAPSGTALTLAQCAAKGRGLPFPECLDTGSREGLRPSAVIGMSVQRGGGVIGEHTIRFLGENESLEFTHRGLNRSLFADGALAAARWIVGKAPGLYEIRDVFGLAK